MFYFICVWKPERRGARLERLDCTLKASKLRCANVKKLVRRAHILRGFLPIVIGILPKVEMSQKLKFVQLNENSLNMIRS